MLENKVTKNPRSGLNLKVPAWLQVPFRLGWRENYDLLLLLGLALGLPGLVVLPVPLVRVPLGLAIVLLAPGYALVAAVLPRRHFDLVSQLAASFGLSIAAIAVLALLLNSLSWGIQEWSIVISLSLWIGLFSGAALIQRSFLAAQNSTPLNSEQAVNSSPLAWWRDLAGRARLGYLVGTVLLVGVLGYGLVTMVVLPAPAEKLTEFYAVGTDGLAQDYTRELVVNEEAELKLGIVNREGAIGSYRIEVRSANKMAGSSDTFSMNSWSKLEYSLRYGLDKAGDNQKVDILLYYNNQPVPYRQLRLWLNVREKAAYLT